MVNLFSEPSYKALGRCEYLLVPASRQGDQFGFDLDSDTPFGQRAVHGMHKHIPTTTRSPQVAALACLWYQTCLHSHSSCSPSYWHSRHFANADTVVLDQDKLQASTVSPTWYPPRLLDVSRESVYLVPRHNVQPGSKFAALSHCWGQVPFLGLVADAIPSYEQDGIELAKLPQNFRDVVEICRWLQIPYLWIDSLCIIQSGPGSQMDWNNHVNVMRMIYATSDLCISTAAADGATNSCFAQRDARVIAPLSLMFNGEVHLLLDRDHTRQDFEDSSLALRAWTFQEKLISRRVLTFGAHDVFWQCCETGDSNISETFPQGMKVGELTYRPFSLPEFSFPSRHDTSSLRHTWLDLIKTYSGCQLTRSHQDKLVAFAGIAQHMHNLFDNSPYIAGLFLDDLPAALLWNTTTFEEAELRPTPPPGFYRAPSWSWAAMDDQVSFRYDQAPGKEDIVSFTTLTGHSVDVAHAGSPYGQLLRAELTLRGPLIPLKWERIYPASDEQPKSEYLMVYEPSSDNSQTVHYYETTVIHMPGINHQTKRHFDFDSRNDRNGTQDGMCFLPFHDLLIDGDVHIGGIIVRPTARIDHMSHLCDTKAVFESVDTTLPCYMRIGRGLVEGVEFVARIEELPMQVFVLL